MRPYSYANNKEADNMPPKVEPFEVKVADEVLDDLKRRLADGSRSEHVRKGGALGGQPVEVRSLDDLASHEAGVRPAMVVANDQDHVRRGFRSLNFRPAVADTRA